MTNLNNFIAKGDFLAVKNLIENEGYSPNNTGFLGLSHTPLYTATISQNAEIIDYLIQKGADVNAPVRSWGLLSYTTPMDIALMWGHTPVVASLLAVNAKITDKYSNIELESFRKNQIVTEYLVKAAAQNDTASIEKILKNEYADVNKSIFNIITNEFEANALGTAVKENHFQATSLLLEKGAIVHAASSLKEHAFNLVKDVQIAELLIKHTPIANDFVVELIMLGKTELVPLLIKNGALINEIYFDGTDGFITPLQAAISVDDSALVKLLVSNGADLATRIMDQHYSTPLEYAAVNGKLQALETLIQLSSNLTDKNVLSDQTALELAFKAGQMGAVHMLLLHGAEVPEYIQSKLDSLKPIETNQVLTGDQIITPAGQEIQSVQHDSHSTVSENSPAVEFYVQPVGSVLGMVEHEQVFVG